MALFGCDTFVVLPPLTAKGEVIFGKNSDRPKGEVQEVVYYPEKRYKPGEKLQCTYIEINQVPLTHAVLLSKPAWMWGAEMGGNSHGVVIGNEAVFTVVEDDSYKERLLGMDLLRLGLERASSSSEAVEIITKLLEDYGQGGPCSDTDSNLVYHNSFLIADHEEVWVLEAAGKHWAAEKLVSGYRNISNCLSIGTNITKQSGGMLNFAKEHKFWDGKSDFNFKAIFSTGGCPREAAGRKLLEKLTADKNFNAEKIFQILRDKDSTICRSADDPFHTSGSLVSVLRAKPHPSCHWITATPDPSESLFKPFIFSTSPDLSTLTQSPVFNDDPAKTIPRFQFKVDRRHELYKKHELALKKNKASVLSGLKSLEHRLLEETDHILQNVQINNRSLESCDKLLRKYVEMEMLMYDAIL